MRPRPTWYFCTLSARFSSNWLRSMASRSAFFWALGAGRGRAGSKAGGQHSRGTVTQQLGWVGSGGVGVPWGPTPTSDTKSAPVKTIQKPPDNSRRRTQFAAQQSVCDTAHTFVFFNINTKHHRCCAPATHTKQINASSVCCKTPCHHKAALGNVRWPTAAAQPAVPLLLSAAPHLPAYRLLPFTSLPVSSSTALEAASGSW